MDMNGNALDCVGVVKMAMRQMSLRGPLGVNKSENFLYSLYSIGFPEFQSYYVPVYKNEIYSKISVL